MRTLADCWRSLAAGAVLAAALTPHLAPAAPAATEKESPVSPVEKLRKDLDKPLTLKIDKQPLSTAVDMLHQKTGITFALDITTIQQQLGFTPDQPPSPVDVDLKDVKVRTALRAILAPYNLDFAPIGDTVIITTDDVAMFRQMRQRINVDLDKVDFATALKQIARETAVNLILDSRVEKDASAKVSLQMEDVPLETAVRLLAEMANLKPVRVGNVLFVTSKANAAEMRQDPDLAAPNPGARAMQDQQIGFNINGVVSGVGQTAPAAGAPPGVAPVVPPNAADAPKEVKDSAASDPKAGESKEQKEDAPKEPTK